MFVGIYEVASSGKNRIALPKKMRLLLKSDEAVINKGFEKCLFGFAKEEWEIQVKKQLELPLIEKQGRDLRRYIFSGASVVALDDQGRFVIPLFLWNYANLSTKIAIVGAGDHFEIWNHNTWVEKLKELDAQTQ